MPTYTVEVEGRNIEVQAPNPQAAMAMAASQYAMQEAMRQNPQTPASFQGARASVDPTQPHGRRPVPPPNPRDPSSVVPWLMGQAHNAGLNAAEAITHRSADPSYRYSNPAADAPSGFMQGALSTVGNTALGIVDPSGARNTAQSTVNHVLPVAIGMMNGTSGDQQSALIRQLEQQRLAAGDYTTGERGASMLPDYQPSTGAGEFGGRAGAAAPYLFLPGGALPTILGFGAGEGAGAAAQMGGGNPDQVEAARFGGNLAGATLAAPFTGARPSERVLRNATDNLDLSANPGSDLEMARILMQRSRNLPNDGISVYGDQALTEVAGPRTTPLQAVVRQASRAPRGMRAAAEQQAPLPDQIRNSTMGVADMIAPPVTDPAALGVRAQNAAGAALRSTRSEINSIAGPDYAALENQIMPATEYINLLRNPSYRAAMETVQNTPEIYATVRHLPQNSLAFINTVKHQLTTMEGAAQVSPLNPGGNNFLASLRGSAGHEADALAGGVSPEWLNANGIVSQASAGVLEPMQAGPLGDIGGRPGVPSQADARAATQSLYPADALEGQANVTVQALRAMEGQDAGVGADLTRLHLVRALDQGLPNGGPPSRGRASVAGRLAPNRPAEQTFLAGVNEVAPGAVGSVDDLIRAVRAAGARSPEGSQTATDVTGMSDLGAGELPMEAFRATVSPHQLPARWNSMLDRWQVNQNAGEIMRVLGLPPDEFAAYMRGLPSAGARNRGLGLVKALMAGQAVENQ